MAALSEARKVGIAVAFCVVVWPAKQPVSFNEQRPVMGTYNRADRLDEPFGIVAAVVSDSVLNDKWTRVQSQIDVELAQIADCQRSRKSCASQAALNFIAIIDAARARHGRARIGEVNRAINLAIKPASDLAQHGEADVWTLPLQTLATGAGECEDYAIEFVALRLSGIPAEDLRIVIVKDVRRGAEHALTAARLDSHWLTLDNRRMTMVADTDSWDYRPSFVIHGLRVMRYHDAGLGRAVGESTLHGAWSSHRIIAGTTRLAP